MCYANHFDNYETWNVNIGYRDIYYEKNIKFFLCVEVRNVVEKWNV